MIPQLLNGMITLMLVRFMVNAVPHALELLPPPAYNSVEPYLTTKVYHVTHKDNLPSIMAEGLKRGGQWIFSFPTLEMARESGLSDMAILEVTLTSEDIDKCEVGEIFPELYEQKFGGEPPGDTSLRDYLENPRQYGIAEVSCTVDRIPPKRIRYIETIKRIEYS